MTDERTFCTEPFFSSRRALQVIIDQNVFLDVRNSSNRTVLYLLKSLNTALDPQYNRSRTYLAGDQFIPNLRANLPSSFPNLSSQILNITDLENTLLNAVPSVTLIGSDTQNQ